MVGCLRVVAGGVALCAACDADDVVSEDRGEMVKSVNLVLIIAGLAVPLGAASHARPAKCLLEVNGVTYIDGACDFRSLEDGTGSFQITGPKGTYFAYLYVEGANRATAHWNEEPGASHAHSPLGSLRRVGACWTSETVKLCAW